jgi:hypothetical protein
MNKYRVITHCIVKTEYIVEAETEKEAEEIFGDSMETKEFEWENEEVQSIELLKRNI